MIPNVIRWWTSLRAPRRGRLVVPAYRGMPTMTGWAIGSTMRCADIGDCSIGAFARGLPPENGSLSMAARSDARPLSASWVVLRIARHHLALSYLRDGNVVLVGWGCGGRPLDQRRRHGERDRRDSRTIASMTRLFWAGRSCVALRSFVTAMSVAIVNAWTFASKAASRASQGASILMGAKKGVAFAVPAAFHKRFGDISSMTGGRS